MNVRALLNDELAQLTAGAEFITRGRTITERDLTAFSALTGDWHPRHSDTEWAAKSRLADRVAHGMLVLSYAVGLLPFDPDRVIALRGLESATFKRTVIIGDTIHVRCSVASTRRLDDKELVKLDLRILNQRGRVVACASLEALCRPLPRAARVSEPGQETYSNQTSAIPRDGFWDQFMHLYGGEMWL